MRARRNQGGNIELELN